MRLAFRGTLFLLALYAVSVVGLFVMVDRMLQEAAWATMEETAQAVGQEVVRALSEPLREATLGTDQAARARLRALVDAYVEASPLVTDAAVIDTYGQVVLGNAGRGPYPAPRQLFGGDRRPRLVHTAGATLRSGIFLLDVPVHAGEEPMGYIRLKLDSARLGRLFETARRRLLAAAGLGLLAIGVAGFLLHARLARRQRLLVRTLDAMAEGGSNGAVLPDEERPVRAAAERLGDTLRRERELRDAARRGISQVGRLLDVGVAVLGPQGELEFVEPRARKLLGLSEGQVNGSWERLAGQLRPTLDRARLGGSKALCDLEPRPGNDMVRVHAIPTEGNGGFVLLVRDRTAVQAIQTDLRMAAHLRNLTRLYLGVAHDLRAPVHAMGLNLELLRRSLQGADAAASPPELKWVDVLERETARLKRGLEVVLAQTAPSHRDRQTFDLRALVADVGALLGPQARQQAVHLDVDVPAEPVPVHALRDAMAQALCNLCINGLEAMPDGGTLWLSLVVDDAAARLVVRDTGSGIPPDVTPRIFQMHVTTKQSGTGIGLYVAKSVAEADGGDLELIHTGPAGTRFELRLPRAAPAPPARADLILKEEVS